MTTNTDIINFYNQIGFPGKYSVESIKNYQKTWNNIFIDFIDSKLYPGASVLDVGCGTGLIKNLLASKHTCNFTGIDFSDSIEYAKTMSLSLDNNVNWIRENFVDYTTTDRYDIIICQGVLHHIIDYQKAIDNMIRLKKNKDSILLIGVYHPLGKFLQKFRKNFINDILRIDQKEHPFEKSWTKKEIQEMFSPLKLIDTNWSLINIANSSNGGLTIYVFK